jgi:hypothetical protein
LDNPAESILAVGSALFRVARFSPSEDLVPILASGSNASPEQLLRKFPNQPRQGAIIVLRGWVQNAAPVYAAHYSRYGSVSTTFAPAPGAVAQVFCVFLPKENLHAMHRSEGLGKNYGFYVSERPVFSLAPRGEKIRVFTYLSLRGALAHGGAYVQPKANIARGFDALPLSQKDAQLLVQSKLASSAPIESFILENIESQKTREARIETLKREHSIPHASTLFSRIA